MRSPRGPHLPFLLLLASACNAPPSAPTVAIEPEEPGTSDDIVARIAVESSDDNAKDTVSYDYVWYQDGVQRIDFASEIIQASVTTKGETWMVEVTPDDGTEPGEPGTATVTIANTPPVATVEISPVLPLATEDLVALAEGSDDDDDAVTFAYTWTVDAASSSYAGDTVPASATLRGEVWEVTVTPNDGEDQGTPVSAAVSIDNTAPVISDATLGPEPAYEGSTLEVSWNPSDDDGDEVSASFDFYVDGSLAQQGATPTLVGGLFDKGQEVHAIVTPNDGFIDGEAFTTNTVEISNSAPSYSAATIDPAEVFENSTASCVPSGWYDPDGDSEDHSVAWYVEGALVSEDATIDGASFDRDDELVCELTPWDGETAGTPVSSDVLTVSNTAPTIASATLSTTSPTEADNISVTLGSTADADGDSITVGYAWSVNGTVVAAVPSLSGTYFDKGDTIVVVVTPSDGSDDGTPVTSDTAIAVNSPPEITSLSLSPGSVYTDDSLVASAVSTDADGDSVSIDYAWYVDSSGIAAAGNTVSGATWFDKGQQVYVVATPDDGDVVGSSRSSSTVTVLNSPPTSPSVIITPTEPVAGDDDLLCEIVTESIDDDGDLITYGWTWRVNGATHGGMQIDSATSSLVPGSETDDAETWQCAATPDDGDDEGSAGTASVDIGDGGEEPCTYPDETLTLSTGPAAGPTFSPYYYSVDWIATVTSDLFYDWDNAGSQSPGYIEFEFFDSSGTSVCSIYYDTDDAFTATGWTTSSGGALYGAWEIPLSGGYTTCTAVSPATWGTNDLRDLLESWTWGLGVGEVIDIESDLRSAVTGAGYNWLVDWAPYLVAGYLYSDLFGYAYEVQYGWGWQQTCGVLDEDSGGDNIKLPAATSAPLDDAIWDINGYYLFYASSLVP
jgi:hypothetical protein